MGKSPFFPKKLKQYPEALPLMNGGLKRRFIVSFLRKSFFFLINFFGGKGTAVKARKNGKK